ncbi:LOW QUALITY PROTEIN: hypothetical protein PHMEG_00021289 [Phytophthora megakarya]|uniref:Chromo domain-containing protein n=1 Tax=Phytophthora megakarya TaxID=4795 RepID=A0A225VLQ0_9STRA|nr:LOW QUALITY PROTEIN: hypothetical protein PHMEG_00021289 [Phytophthora megakarya]
MEHGLDDDEWPYLLPAVQANLNHTRVQSLTGRVPIEVFTALPASSALDAIVVPATTARNQLVVNLEDIGDFVEQMRSSLHTIHEEVLDVKERQRTRDIVAHIGTPTNFDIGDFILWSRIDQRLPNRKLLVGPFKVISALPHCFHIEHLVTARKYEVHGSRLKFYADSDLHTTTEFLEVVANQGMLLGVEEFRNHRYNQDFGPSVSWVGLQAIEDSWEPFSTLLQDVPIKVRNYVNANANDELHAQLN